MDEALRPLRDKAMKLPLTPGVYIMKNQKGEIIYIGKAKALKNRVSQYFGSQHNHNAKVRKMVENVADFDYILTDSEFEALVLECSLIKQNQPKYNILLKDDKGYSYVKITPPPYGRLQAVFRKENDKATYIGPFTGSFSVHKAVDEAAKIFKLPTCHKNFPADIGKGRPCLNYHIGLCCGVCTGKVRQAEYDSALQDAVDFIKNGGERTVKVLKKQMEQAAEDLEFELAAKLRDRIQAIARLSGKQKVISETFKHQDVFGLAESPDCACLAVLRFQDGLLFDSETFILESLQGRELPEVRNELIIRYYSMQRTVPPRIGLDGEVADEELLCRWLSEKAGRKVTVGVPQRGEQVQLIKMCRSNAAEKLSQHTGRRGKQAAALDELALLLGLDKPPLYIESYDISHTAGSDNVAGMVVFRDGAPLRSAYRRFAIKGFDGQDDVGSMREVISRRLNRYEQEKENPVGFGRLPDLILLDGGLPQLNAVVPVIEAFGLSIPTFGMVKDDKHRTRAIAASGGEISISSVRKAFTLVSEIQEEVHRFAISYHHKKHTASSLESSLTQIPGIGPKKAAALLQHFRTVRAISSANKESLCQVSGIGNVDADNIISFFTAKKKDKK